MCGDGASDRRALIPMVSRSLVLLIVLAGSLLYGCNTPIPKAKDSIQDLPDRIADLSRKYAVEQVVLELRNHPWEREHDPRLVIQYVNALFQTGRPLPSSLREPAVPRSIAIFAHAYLALAKGNFKEAVPAFRELTALPGAEQWGYLGLLEAAIHAENPTEMRVFVGRLKTLVNGETDAWSVPLYIAMSHLFSGDYEALKSFLADTHHRLHPVERASLEVRLLLRSNDFQRARSVIRDVPARYRDDANIVLSLADVIETELGPDAYATYMDEQIRRLPAMWYLQVERAYRLLEAGNQHAVKRGVALLKGALKEKKLDVVGQLQIANALLDKEYGDAFADAVRRLSDSYGYVPLYHASLARAHLLVSRAKRGGERERELERAQAEIERAIGMSPWSPDVLWVQYRIEREQGRNDRAIGVLRSILHIDPHDVFANVELVEMCERTGRDDDALATADVVRSERRYISSDLRDRVHSSRARIHAFKGRVAETEEALVAIKDDGVRRAVREEVNAIRGRTGG